MTDRTGQSLGHYTLIRMLGRGGFADVYLGEHIYLKTQAAIKVLHAQISHDSMEQFLAEARTIARLMHPHIVRVHDFGVDNATPFLVMEYAPNGTLRQRHPRGTVLPLALVVPYSRQIAGALQFAHDQRLIHRDVKPENMLLGYNNEVLLSDFGIATIAQTSRSLPTQDISGTIAYMAPEQVQGKARPTSDQYSLAVIVYEWLTGRCPFQGSFTEIATQQLFITPASPRSLNPSISPEVEHILMTALSKNPEARFARVEAFANALDQASRPGQISPTIVEAPFMNPSPQPPTLVAPPPVLVPLADTGPTYISNQPVETPAPAPPATLLEATLVASDIPAQPGRGISRRALIGVALGIVVVAGGSGLAWSLLAHSSPNPNAVNATTGAGKGATTPVTGITPHATPTTPATPTATSPTAVNTPLIYTGPNQEFSAAWSPDGTRIVSAGAGSVIEVWDARTSSRLFTMNSNGATSVFRAAWSPDGSKIASGDSTGNINIWDASNGNLISAISAHQFQVNSVAWSPDSSKVVSGSGDKTAKVWDVATGSNLVTYSKHSHYLNTVAWSHDGARIVTGSGDNTAHVWDAGTGQQYFIYTGHTNEVLALAWSPGSDRIVSASDDKTVRIWDAFNGNTYVIYPQHTDFVVAVDWSPDGQKIVSGSRDRTTRVWSAISGVTIQVFTGHTNEVESVAWAFDSRRAASASRDGTVGVWVVS